MKRRCNVQIKQTEFSAMNRVNAFSHANTHAEKDVVMTVQALDVLSGSKRFWVAGAMMSVAFVMRMFPNVFVQIRALGVCLVATNKLFVAPKIPKPYFVLHPAKDS